jgi:hypothetical protein
MLITERMKLSEKDMSPFGCAGSLLTLKYSRMLTRGDLKEEDQSKAIFYHVISISLIFVARIKTSTETQCTRSFKYPASLGVHLSSAKNNEWQ